MQEVGHIKSEYPLRNNLKKKAIVVTWDDSDEELTYEEQLEEVLNLALVTIGNEHLINLMKDQKGKRIICT